MNLILYSVFNKSALLNFQNNVINGINNRDLLPYLSDKHLLDIDLDNNNKSYFWGCKDTKYYIQKVKRIKQGDYILFAKDKKFIYLSQVIDVFKNKSLGNYLFGDSIYSNIFLLNIFGSIDITYEELFKELGYNNKLKINGLFLVSEDKCKMFFQKYKDINEYIKNRRAI